MSFCICKNILFCFLGPVCNGTTTISSINLHDEVGYKCFCERGYTSKFCDVNINECEIVIYCYITVCSSTVGSDYKCSCWNGFNGKSA